MPYSIFQEGVFAGAEYVQLLRGLPAEALARISEFVTIAATAAVAVHREETRSVDITENARDHKHAGEDDALVLLLSDHQHFANVVPREKEFDGREVAKQILDVAIVEDPLQREGCRRISVLAMIAFRVQCVHL